MLYLLVCLVGLQTLVIVWLGRALALGRLKLTEAEGSLSEANQIKTDFLSNVSHELRTPMTGIKGYVDNMLDGIAGDITEKQARYLARVKVNADRLTELINDLLDLSRIDQGRADLLEIGAVEFQVSVLLEELAKEIKPIAEHKSLSFSVESDSETVYADRIRVGQILHQLTDNALKFTQDGGIRIAVDRGENGSVAIRVEDTGPGIPVEERERVFDRFYQIQEGQNITPGSGLGLSIARELTEVMDGHLWVEEREGPGSSFCTLSPCQVLNTQPARWAACKRGGCEMSVHILICDDEPDIAEVLSDRLEAAGFDVRVVDCARACYAAVAENKPDLVLMDIQMPEISGMEALAELKTHHPEIPVLMVSASTTREVARESIVLGASGFLLKPFEPAELMDRVYGILGETTEHNG